MDEKMMIELLDKLTETLRKVVETQNHKRTSINNLLTKY